MRGYIAFAETKTLMNGTRLESKEDVLWKADVKKVCTGTMLYVFVSSSRGVNLKPMEIEDLAGMDILYIDVKPCFSFNNGTVCNTGTEQSSN